MNRSFIVKRLAIKFGIATSLTFVLLLVSHQAINNLPDQWVQFHTVSLEKYTAASKGKSDLGNAIHNFKDYVLRRQDYDQKFMADMAMIDQGAASYENNHGDMSEYEMSALQQIKKSADAYHAAMKTVIEMKTSGASIEEIDKTIKDADRR